MNLPRSPHVSQIPWKQAVAGGCTAAFIGFALPFWTLPPTVSGGTLAFIRWLYFEPLRVLSDACAFCPPWLAFVLGMGSWGLLGAWMGARESTWPRAVRGVAVRTILLVVLLHILFFFGFIGWLTKEWPDAW